MIRPSLLSGKGGEHLNLQTSKYVPLSHPVRITEQQWPEGTRPVVSICCITYNHEPFIRDAIEGFLIQETTFPVEILVRDDASTDNTPFILRQYCSRHPQLIRPIFETHNGYSEGIHPFPQVIAKAHGEFIALCEGDDFWIDSKKLELQIAHLRQHSNVSLVSTNRVGVDRRSSLKKEGQVRAYTLKEVLAGYIPHTQTVVYRNSPVVMEIRNAHLSIPNGDRMIAFANALIGKLHHLPQATACYRDTGEGVWSKYSTLDRQIVSLERLVAFHKAIGVYPNSILDRCLIERCAMHVVNFRLPINHRLRYLEICFRNAGCSVPRFGVALVVQAVKHVFSKVYERLQRYCTDN